MQRYFVDASQIVGNEVTIDGDDAKHIIRVMRMNVGDEVVCSDGSGTTVRCEITKLADRSVILEVKERLTPNTELPIHVTIAQALPKGDKLDFIIQKGTELGASSFIPFTSKRSLVKWDEKKARKKIERLTKIAKEAAEQSYREKVPTISEVLTFSELQKRLAHFDEVIVAYEEAAKEKEQTNFRKVLTKLSVGASLLVIIGPEGGLAEEEVQLLQNEKAMICGFGPRILRTETAALYALSAISYHFEL